MIKIIQVGLGPIGAQLARLLAGRRDIEIAGALDVDTSKVGKDLGTLCGLPEPLGILVSDQVARGISETTAQLALLTTVSSLERQLPLILDSIRAGLNVLSTCEELSHPWQTHPEIARQIDQASREKGVSVLGTGINPGFLMDLLPLALTGVCSQVEAIRVERIQDASRRRIPFQRKIGAGLSREQFEERAAQGKLRHVGLTESMHMIADRLGWRLERCEDIIEPVLAERRTTAGRLTVEAGQALGVLQTGRGFRQGREVVTLIFRAALGQPDPRDRIAFTGTPSFEMVIPGGINGDIGTCAITANAVPVVIDAPAGLLTMADVPVVACGEGTHAKPQSRK